MVVREGYGLSYYPGTYMSQSFLKNAPFTSAYGPVINFGANANFGRAGFRSITTTANAIPRQMPFALKLLF